MKATGSNPHRRWTNRAVEREVDPRRARRLWGWLVAIVLAAAPFAAYLLAKNECVRLSYELNDLRDEQEELVELRRRLAVDRAELASLDEVESWAVERYGLVRPDPEHVIVVTEDWIGRNTPAPTKVVADGAATEGGS